MESKEDPKKHDKNKFRLESTTLPIYHVNTHDETKDVETWHKVNAQTGLTWPWVSTELQHRVPPVPAANRLATDCSGWCLERCLHCTKRTIVVSTDGNTPAVWSAVRVPTRQHAAKKTESNRKPPCKYRRSPCLPEVSDKRCSKAMIPPSR